MNISVDCGFVSRVAHTVSCTESYMVFCPDVLVKTLAGSYSGLVDRANMGQFNNYITFDNLS